MKKLRDCKHCRQQFESRRSNHLYCAPSCRTKASYKRNNYKYIPGHYERAEDALTQGLAVPGNQELFSAVQALEEKIEGLQKKKSISSTSVQEAALGTVAADTLAFGLKRVFAPLSLPATKGDVEKLKNDLEELKRLLQKRTDKTDSFWGKY